MEDMSKNISHVNVYVKEQYVIFLGMYNDSCVFRLYGIELTSIKVHQVQQFV
jgi:hypothetical protein